MWVSKSHVSKLYSDDYWGIIMINCEDKLHFTKQTLNSVERNRLNIYLFIIEIVHKVHEKIEKRENNAHI